MRTKSHDRTKWAVEDYAKAIYALQSRRDEAVSTNDLAARLGLTPGTVSEMVKKLADQGYVTHEPYRGVRLTRSGKRVALEVIRHHRLIELFLAETLNIPWDRVHEEAEVLEHVLSEELEESIATKLGNPTTDPHGDPIPTPELKIQERTTTSLQSLEPGNAGRFVRVSDSDSAMLRYLAECGISPGDEFTVVDKQPFGGPVFVEFAGKRHAIGGDLAAAMRVEIER